LTQDEPASLIELGRQRLATYVARTIPLGDWKPAAVLLLLFGTAGDERILLTVRSHEVEYHKGQISLPGGAVDGTDTDIIMTALREAEEEVGIDRSTVEILGRLDDRVTVSDFLVTPIVGALRQRPVALTPSPFEVAEILEVPIRHLLDSSNRVDEQRVRNGEVEMRPAYDFGRHHIFGATARILADLLDLLGGSGSVFEAREVTH